MLPYMAYMENPMGIDLAQALSMSDDVAPLPSPSHSWHLTAGDGIKSSCNSVILGGGA